MHGEHHNAFLHLRLSCSADPPSTGQLRKTLMSASFTSSSALRGQRPRGVHGPSAAFQDGQPPALVSGTEGQPPSAGVKQQRPHSPRLLTSLRTQLSADSPAPTTRAPGGHRLHIPSRGPWASLQNYFQLQELSWVGFPMRFYSPPPRAPAGRSQGGRAKRLTRPRARSAQAHPMSVSRRLMAPRLEGPQLYRASSKYWAHRIDFSIWKKKKKKT